MVGWSLSFVVTVWGFIGLGDIFLGRLSGFIYLEFSVLRFIEKRAKRVYEIVIVQVYIYEIQKQKGKSFKDSIFSKIRYLR